jgi:hypothetical protein
MDARKRYNGIWMPIAITLIVFVLNFPALVLYLIVRPDEEYFDQWADASHGHGSHHHGLEVPVVKFTDDNGEVKLSLNLKINSDWKPNSDMNVEVAWDSERKDIELSARKAAPVEEGTQESIGSRSLRSGIKRRVFSIGSRAKGSLRKLSPRRVKKQVEEAIPEQEPTDKKKGKAKDKDKDKDKNKHRDKSEKDNSAELEI